MVRHAAPAARPLNSKLRDLIITRTQRIRKERDRHPCEQDTKATLIEPVLKALDWDIHDWDEVHREYRTTGVDSPVDYALKIEQNPRLFLEAKALGSNLSDHKFVAQVLKCAFMADVTWCVLTDGDEWRIYNSTAAVSTDERLFLSFRMSDGNTDEALATLSLLAKDSVKNNGLERRWATYSVDRQVKQALLKMLESRNNGLAQLIQHKVRKLKPKQIAESLRRLDVQIGFSRGGGRAVTGGP